MSFSLARGLLLDPGDEGDVLALTHRLEFELLVGELKFAQIGEDPVELVVLVGDLDTLTTAAQKVQRVLDDVVAGTGVSLANSLTKVKGQCVVISWLKQYLFEDSTRNRHMSVHITTTY